MMTRVAVVGATGYAGAELIRILAGHPKVRIAALTSRQHSGKLFSQVYPSMSGVVDIPCEEFSIDSLAKRIDLIFIALPHKLPMEIVPALVKKGIRIVDLSADFRFSDVTLYETHYQPHTCPELLKKAVYGLSEVYKEKIRSAAIIGNPGCYPTSTLLPLIPLIKAGLIETERIIVDSKSGVSGAGRSLSLTTHHCEVNESFKAYKVANHRHNPEMDEVLSKEADKAVHVTFVPHLVPMTRGMETTIYAILKKKNSEEQIRNCISEFYNERPFIRLRTKGTAADTLHVKGTNFCDIGIHVDQIANLVVLTSAIDNLVKGAAGQAVQNMNIMLNLDETLGLMTVPYPL
jgi:N-acetyl-gamma-glutamyl-phosphate reductase